MKRWPLALVVAGTVAACGGSATAPDRHGPYTLAILCDTSASTPLTCTANLYCGLYGCEAGVPTGNVTNVVSWSVDDVSVAALTGNGVLISVSPGKTILRAVLQSGSDPRRQITLTGSQRIGVFLGTAPLPLSVLSGYVYDGATVLDGRINGALVEVTAGLLQGATSITGIPPAGSGFVSIPGQYNFLDAPPGTMGIRVSAPGYVTVTRDIVFPTSITADLSVQLHH